MDQDQVRNLVGRPRLYYNIDGLGELGGGVMLLGFALALWMVAHSPANSVWHKIALPILLVLALALRYGTKAIKSRITYPRTGYVEYRRSVHWRASIIAAVLAALLPPFLVAAEQRHWDVTTLASLAGRLVYGLIAAGAYAYHFARAVRWKWVVVCAMALGSLVITSLPAGVLAALANDSLVAHPVRAEYIGALLLYLMTFGAILLISGAISFWLYLCQTQSPAQESQ